MNTFRLSKQAGGGLRKGDGDGEREGKREGEGECLSQVRKREVAGIILKKSGTKGRSNGELTFVALVQWMIDARQHRGNISVG